MDMGSLRFIFVIVPDGRRIRDGGGFLGWSWRRARAGTDPLGPSGGWRGRGRETLFLGRSGWRGGRGLGLLGPWRAGRNDQFVVIVALVLLLGVNLGPGGRHSFFSRVFDRHLGSITPTGGHSVVLF